MSHRDSPAPATASQKVPEQESQIQPDADTGRAGSPNGRSRTNLNTSRIKRALVASSSQEGEAPSNVHNHSSRRVCRAPLVVAVSAMTAGMLGLAATSASAASGSAGDFSAFVPNNPTVSTVDDCTVEVGPVVDTIPAPNYRKVGGVRVNCASVHTVIKATVWEQYWNGSAWVNLGYSGVGTRNYSTGSGSEILKSPGVCSPYPPGWNVAWRTVALVQTENVGGYRYSAWAYDNRGCATG